MDTSLAAGQTTPVPASYATDPGTVPGGTARVLIPAPELSLVIPAYNER